MFAAVTRSPGDIVVNDIPELGPSRPGRVVVRPETAGICGSDLHLFSGHTGALSDARDFFPGIPQAPPHLELRLVGVQERLDVKANAAFPAGDLDAGCAAFAEPMSIAVHAPCRAGPSAWGEGGKWEGTGPGRGPDRARHRARHVQITVSGGGAET